MTERKDREPSQSPAEGVRIIPAEEAQAALEAGAAAGRRPDDQLRFGDVPPAPLGPRPTHRFPLPTFVDPAEVPHPPVATPVLTGPPTESVPELADADMADRAEMADRTDEQLASGAPANDEPAGDDAWDTGAWRSETWESASWEPAPLAPGPTGWAPPPGWEPPLPPPPPPQPARVPSWDSPLDAAEGISPAPHSWTPPEAWATPPPPPPSTSPPGEVGIRPAPESGPIEARRPGDPGESLPAGPGLEPLGSSNDDRRSDVAVGAQDRTLVGAAEYPRAEPTLVSPWSDETAAGPLGEEASPGEVGAGDFHREPPATAYSTALEEGITVTGGFETDLPHWTDPPTGEVPRLGPEVGPGDEPDDMQAWQAVGSTSSARWRDDADDWNDSGGLGDLGSDETRVGALDSSRTEHSDLYSFDEDFERLDEERSGSHRATLDDHDDPEEDFEVAPERISTSVRASSGARAARVTRPRPQGGGLSPGAPPGGGRDLASAIGVGVVLAILLAIAYAIGPKALLVYSAGVVLACAVEAFGMVQRRGFRPATLLGLVGVVGLMFAAYWRGAGALPLVSAVVFVATMLWYLLGVVEARPLANVSATLMTYFWVGLLGSFAALLLRAPHGRGLFLGAVLPTVAADIVAYFVGSRIGSRTLAPSISPGKTVEGVVAGGLAAIFIGAIIGSQVSPWGGLKHGLELGLVVAVLGPVGDLFESMIKRDLSVKDSGSALPGHGGLLDRFDSLLVVLPAAYYLATLFGIHLQ